MLKQFKILLGSTLIVFANLAYTQGVDSKDTSSPVPSDTIPAPSAAKQPDQSSVDSRKEKRQAKRQARQEQRAKKKAAKDEYKAKERAAKEEQKLEKNKGDANP